MSDEKRDYKREAKENAVKLVDDFSNLVNGSPDVEAIVEQFKREHRTLQQSMFRVILTLIVSMTKDDYHTDGRNEQSKDIAKKLILGYAEMVKREDKVRMLAEGCGEEYSEEKSEKYRMDIVNAPEKYIGLSFI